MQFGKPVIAGTRVPVDVAVGHLAAGDTPEEVMREYSLTHEQVLGALQYASKVLSDEFVFAR